MKELKEDCSIPMLHLLKDHNKKNPAIQGDIDNLVYIENMDHKNKMENNKKNNTDKGQHKDKNKMKNNTDNMDKGQDIQYHKDKKDNKDNMANMHNYRTDRVVGKR